MPARDADARRRLATGQALIHSIEGLGFPRRLIAKALGASGIKPYLNGEHICSDASLDKLRDLLRKCAEQRLGGLALMLSHIASDPVWTDAIAECNRICAGPVRRLAETTGHQLAMDDEVQLVRAELAREIAPILEKIRARGGSDLVKRPVEGEAAFESARRVEKGLSPWPE